MKLAAYLFLLVIFPAVKGRSSPSVEELLQKADELYRSRSSHSEVQMEIHTPHWSRTLDLEMWSEGQDNTLIVIHSPRKDRGTATLKKGTSMWNYFPKTDRTVKIPPSMMMGSWMGSDLTNDDLVKENTFIKAYTAKEITPKESPHRLVELKPKAKTVTVWDRIEVAFDPKTHFPVYQKDYNERGELVRQISFSEVKNLGGRKLPTVMTIEPKKATRNVAENAKAKKTILRYVRGQFDQKIDPQIFSKKNLRKRR